MFSSESDCSAYTRVLYGNELHGCQRKQALFFFCVWGFPWVHWKTLISYFRISEKVNLKQAEGDISLFDGGKNGDAV